MIYQIKKTFVCDISVRIGCYNSGITERMVQTMSILQTTDLKKYCGTELNITKALDEVVCLLALGDKLNNMPNNLSGGQQRVAIARAPVSKPAIVLTGNLDSQTSGDVLGLLKVASSKFHQTLVMITHNNKIAQLANRIVRIEDGKIVQ